MRSPPPGDLLPLGLGALIFDLDGTLVDVGPLQLRMWSALLRAPRLVGAYKPALEAMRSSRHRDFEGDFLREIALRAGTSPERAAPLVEQLFRQRWTALFRHGRPRPAALHLIAEADRRGIPRAVVSDQPALDKLEALGLGGWAAVVDCTRLGALKPHPDGLRAALSLLGCPASLALFVGDRWDSDGRAAALAGCSFLHIGDPTLPR